MHDALSVRMGDGFADLDKDILCARNIQLALVGQQNVEADAVQIIHDDIRRALLSHAKIVNGSEIGAGEIAGGTGLLFKSFLAALVLDEVGIEHFDGKCFLQLVIPDFVDGTHAALPEEALDLVAVGEVGRNARKIGGHRVLIDCLIGVI